MTMATRRVTGFGVAGLVSILAVEAAVDVPVGGGPQGIDGLVLASVGGLTAEVVQVANADGDRAAVRVAFAKEGEERRLLAFEGKPAASLEGVRALALRARLALKGEGKARLVVVVHDSAGGAWYKVGRVLAPAGEFSDCRLPVAKVQRAGFSQTTADAPDWAGLRRVWLGVVIDGAVQGTLELSSARFTDEPYRPTGPLQITGKSPGTWGVSKESAVTAKLTTPNEGPDGTPCMKVEFTFPGNRHMYLVPRVPIPDGELDGYRALAFRYKATLPKGIGGLLVSIMERGGAQYCAEKAPGASAEWTAVEIPFESFRLGSWSKDANGRLDIDQASGIVIGAHGVTSEAAGKGTIWAADIRYVP